MSDSISRQAAIDALMQHIEDHKWDQFQGALLHWTAVKVLLQSLPSAEPETCEGCKHLGKWENEVEYGYPSPCTRCKRRVEDRYER